MADTTIKVSTDVRDRLAVLAAERGTTIRDLVDQLAAQTSTATERHERQQATAAYIREHLRPGFGTAEDLAAGEEIWRQLAAGELTTPAPPATGSASGSAPSSAA